MLACSGYWKLALGVIFPFVLFAQDDLKDSAGPIFLQDTILKTASRDSNFIKRHNIVVYAMDKKKYKARIEKIGRDYLLLNAAPYQSPLYLNEFYLRPDSNLYKIDVEYIYSVGMRKSRKVVQSAGIGGVVGGVLLASLVGAAAEDNGEDFLKAAGSVIVAGGAGFVVGGFTGAIVGLFSRKRIFVNGESKNLDTISIYYGKW